MASDMVGPSVAISGRDEELPLAAASDIETQNMGLEDSQMAEKVFQNLNQVVSVQPRSVRCASSFSTKVMVGKDVSRGVYLTIVTFNDLIKCLTLCCLLGEKRKNYEMEKSDFCNHI